MLNKLQQKRDRTGGQDGFTIIEVLIVLAIAGLIMVIVFLAIPNLQRSQRNNARKSDANNVLAALSEYTGNNSGKPPSASCAGTNCTFISTTSGVKIGYFDTNPANNKIAYYPTVVALGGVSPAPDQLFLVAGAACGSASGVAGPPTTSANSSRQLVAYYGIEGSVGTQCVAE